MLNKTSHHFYTPGQYLKLIGLKEIYNRVEWPKTTNVHPNPTE